MPIRQYLDGHALDPETVRLLGLAFEITRAALKIEEGNEPAKEVVANKLIELAKQGEHDPERLCDCVLTWVNEAAQQSQSKRGRMSMPPGRFR